MSYRLNRSVQLRRSSSTSTEIMECWRALKVPSIYLAEQWPDQCPQPDSESVRAALAAELRRSRSQQWGAVLALAGIAGVLGALEAQTHHRGGVAVALWLGGAFLVGTVAVLLRYRTAPAFERRLPELVAHRFEAAWDLAQERHAAHLAWADRERRRLTLLAQAAAGDVGAVEEAIARTLGEIEFPFDADSQVRVEDGAAMILFDLPELEDVIPETSTRYLKNGDTKEVRRTATDRQADYLQLALGLALQVARFAVVGGGPAVKRVGIAAYTQRHAERTGVLTDDFVYELWFPTAAVESWDFGSVEPMEVIDRGRSRLNILHNQKLKSITPPSWANLVEDR